MTKSLGRRLRSSEVKYLLRVQVARVRFPAEPYICVYVCICVYIGVYLYILFLNKNGSTQIRTGVPRTRISYAAPTPWNLTKKFSFLSTVLLLYFCFSFFSPIKKGHNRIRTNDHGNCSPMLYH